MDLLQIFFRIGASVIIGAVVGLQREYSNNPAGFRTHMLVAIGACIAMITNELLLAQFGAANVNVARMGSYVISGIGFLGAGSIIKDRNRVRGLTTAAGLWVTACLGITAGAGFYLAALIGTVFVFIIIAVMKILEKKLFKERRQIKVSVRNKTAELPEIIKALSGIGASVEDVKVVKVDDEYSDTLIKLTLGSKNPTDTILEILACMHNVSVNSIKIH
ncbi:MAG: MgtC/SapB family protein [Clostridia bacterium]|jgi:putative Mg2+ transporter-C (MgtC) family protein|nr:MgtC/SapB family protein [Clostridia bacterium]MBT7122335.1 MgtC/SapB family protein [Clostridia bacterium]